MRYKNLMNLHIELRTALRRYARILIPLLRALGIALAIAAGCTGVGVALILLGTAWQMAVLSLAGKACIIGGVVYASLRAILAEIEALRRIRES